MLKRRERRQTMLYSQFVNCCFGYCGFGPVLQLVCGVLPHKGLSPGASICVFQDWFYFFNLGSKLFCFFFLFSFGISIGSSR